MRRAPITLLAGFFKKLVDHATHCIAGCNFPLRFKQPNQIRNCFPGRPSSLVYQRDDRLPEIVLRRGPAHTGLHLERWIGEPRFFSALRQASNSSLPSLSQALCDGQMRFCLSFSYQASNSSDECTTLISTALREVRVRRSLCEDAHGFKTRGLADRRAFLSSV